MEVKPTWTRCRLGNIATLQRGFDLPYRNRVFGTTPIVTSSGIEDYHNVARVNAPGVVTGRYGTIGEVFFVQHDYWPHNTALYVRDFHDNDPKFVYYLLKTIDFASHSGKSGVPGVNRNDLHEELVLVPPTKAEQEAIAGALSDADALIESLEQLVAKKRQIKHGAMQHLLTGKNRLFGFTGKWETKRLGELAILSKAGTNPASQPKALFTHFSLPAFDAGECPVLEEGSQIGSNKFIVPSDAILVSKLNPRIPRIWSPQSIPENSVCSTEFLVFVPKQGIDRAFLTTVCKSPSVCSQMELHAIGTTGSHQRINPNQALRITAKVPTHTSEQQAIAAVLTDMNSEIAALEAKLAKARLLKQGMMQELLTGRIRLV